RRRMSVYGLRRISTGCSVCRSGSSARSRLSTPRASRACSGRSSWPRASLPSRCFAQRTGATRPSRSIRCRKRPTSSPPPGTTASRRWSVFPTAFSSCRSVASCEGHRCASCSRPSRCATSAGGMSWPASRLSRSRLRGPAPASGRWSSSAAPAPAGPRGDSDPGAASPGIICAVPGTEAIAVNAAIVGERPTGLGLYALHLIEALDALGEQLIVYTSRPDLVRARHAIVRAIPVAVRPERGTRGHLSRLLWVQTGLRLRVRGARPALLLNLFPEGLLAPGIPQMTVVHDLLPLHYPEEYPRQQHYFRYYVPAVLRFSRTVIVSSESTRRDLLDYYGVPSEKLRVILPGYDARQFSPDGADGRDEPYALYVGNVMPHKNLTRLVEAFALAANRGPGKLVIRGWGRPRHVHGLRERLAALLVDPLDTAAIADAIVRLFADGRLGNELRERGLARARLFSWEKTGRAVQAAIRQAAESG